MITIADLIADYPPNQRLKVGSLNGFFYIGYVGDFLDRQKEISGEIYSYLKRRMDTTKRQYEYLLKYASQRAWDLGQRQVSYTYAEQRVKNFVPIEKRAVTDIYKADNDWDGDCLVVLVTGEEMGKYWTWDEDEPGSVGAGVTGGIV